MSQQISYGSITIKDTTDWTDMTVLYYQSDSSSVAPASPTYDSNTNTISYNGWDNDPPAWENEKYVWQLYMYIYKDDLETVIANVEFSDPVCLTGSDGNDGQMLYGKCTTAANVQEKVVVLEKGSLTLTSGVSVAVTFTNTNTANSPTLKVGSTAAKPIYVRNTTLTSNSKYNWVANSTIIFIYNESGNNNNGCWQMDGTTAAATTATNYIVTNENGIMVADMSNGVEDIDNATSRNVYINSNSVDIRNGKTVLASFGESTKIGMDQTGGFQVDSNQSSETATKVEEGELQTSSICSLTLNPIDLIKVLIVNSNRTASAKLEFHYGVEATQTTTVNSKDCTVLYDGELTFTFSSTSYETTTLYYSVAYRYYYANLSLGPGNSIAGGTTTATIGTGLTSALGHDQLIVGRYNESDANLSLGKKHFLIVGNGTNKENRSNAFSVDENGNIEYSGYIKNGNRVLWTGARYMFDSTSQTITLNNPSSLLSQQDHGYVLAWSAYVSGEAKDYDWMYYFVPKWHATLSGTGGIGISLSKASSNGNGQSWATKYLYIVETETSPGTFVTTISGYSGNNQGNSANFVLRAVIGV